MRFFPHDEPYMKSHQRDPLVFSGLVSFWVKFRKVRFGPDPSRDRTSNAGSRLECRGSAPRDHRTMGHGPSAPQAVQANDAASILQDCWSSRAPARYSKRGKDGPQRQTPTDRPNERLAQEPRRAASPLRRPTPSGCRPNLAKVACAKVWPRRRTYAAASTTSTPCHIPTTR